MDPYVFGPPGSGSVSQRYGSGSFYYQAKIVRKPWFLLFCDFFMTLELYESETPFHIQIKSFAVPLAGGSEPNVSFVHQRVRWVGFLFRPRLTSPTRPVSPKDSFTHNLSCNMAPVNTSPPPPPGTDHVSGSVADMGCLSLIPIFIHPESLISDPESNNSPNGGRGITRNYSDLIASE